MTRTDDFEITFQRLKKILEPYAAKLNVLNDTATSYSLETSHVMKNKHRLFFSEVRMGKAYVSFHLMPVYGKPALLKDISPKLKKRMQGKSCFNFTNVDEELFSELADLTKLGFEAFSSPEVLKAIGVS